MLGILANPSYAGTYVFDRYQSLKQVRASGDITSRTRPVLQEPGAVADTRSSRGLHRLGPVRPPAGLTSLPNQTPDRRLSGFGPPGLRGLPLSLRCGACGRRLGVHYTGNNGIYPVYFITIPTPREGFVRRQCLRDCCRSCSPQPSDRPAIGRRHHAAVTIQLAIAALTNIEERDRDVGAQWRMRIERAHYDVDLAESGGTKPPIRAIV